MPLSLWDAPTQINLGSIELVGEDSSHLLQLIQQLCDDFYCDGKIDGWLDFDADPVVWAIVLTWGIEHVDIFACARGELSECPNANPAYINLDFDHDDEAYVLVTYEQMIPCDIGQIRRISREAFTLNFYEDVLPPTSRRPEIVGYTILFEDCWIFGNILLTEAKLQSIALQGMRAYNSFLQFDNPMKFGDYRVTGMSRIQITTDNGSGAPFWTPLVHTNYMFHSTAEFGDEVDYNTDINGGTCFGAEVEFGSDFTSSADDRCAPGGVAFFPEFR